MSEAPPPPFTLTAAQRRVLGVLIEKSYTTLDQYPLSHNAIVQACNQKSNRSPVANYSEGEVADVLQELTHDRLVKPAETQLGSRVNRYEQTVGPRCGWAPREQAVLAELMLRGPQTVGELRTRCDRMVKMQDLAYVQGIIDSLAADDPPRVVMLPREPGRSAVRFAHTFYPSDEQPPRAATFMSPGPDLPAAPTETVSRPDPDLMRRIETLEARVAALEAKSGVDQATMP